MSRFFQIKTDVARYQRQLRQLSERALPQAMAATSNITAHAVDNLSHRLIAQRMILRNRYTERSLKVSEARVGSTGRVGYAEVGSISPYLPLQEAGGVRRPVRGRRVPVPSETARGGNWRRPVLRRFALAPGVTVSKRRPFTGKFFVLRPGRRGTLRGSAIFTRRGRKLLKIRYVSEPSYRVRPTRWHSDAVKKFGRRALMEQVFIREAKKQLGLIR